MSDQGEDKQGPTAAEPQEASGPNGLQSSPGGSSPRLLLGLSKQQWAGLSILLLSFAIAVWISHRSKLDSLPRLGTPPAPPTVAGVAGFPGQVEVLTNLQLARALTPRELLVGISVTTEAAGSIDVEGGGLVRYQFRSDPGRGPEPERPFGTLARRRYCGRQAVLINQDGIAALEDDARASCRDLAQVLPEPGCPFAKVVELALAHGADQREPLTAEYYLAVSGPAWRVRAGRDGEALAIAGDCSGVLDQHAAPAAPPPAF